MDLASFVDTLPAECDGSDRDKKEQQLQIDFPDTFIFFALSVLTVKRFEKFDKDPDLNGGESSSFFARFLFLISFGTCAFGISYERHTCAPRSYPFRLLPRLLESGIIPGNI